MTIFRFSAGLAMLLVAACAKNMPPHGTELGRIARTGDYANRAAGLKSFTEGRLSHRQQLRRELIGAGFERMFFQDEHGTRCERFDWEGMDWGDAFPSTMFVNICGKEVFANAGQDAP
jgi:hypothetical protein